MTTANAEDLHDLNLREARYPDPRNIVGIVVCLLILSTFALLPATGQTPSLTVVGVKLMKSDPRSSARTFRVQLPSDCADCSLVSDPAYHGENPREIFFHLRVPSDRAVIKNIRVDVGGDAIRSVIVEKNRLPFSAAGGVVTFDLPVVPLARSSTVEVQTSLEWPGIVLRIEHAFPERRAGKYATGDFPALQRATALNLEFGLREAIRDLKLDREAASRGLGKIHLMGFDTNDPLGHEDYPPHIHLILRWPHFAGSQAPHFYIGDRGLLLPDVSVTIDGMPQIHATEIAKGAWLPATDYLNETLFETLVTDDGGITLRRSGAASCALKPLGTTDRGFADGALVTCGSGVVYRVQAADDTERGEVRVSVNSLPAEVYRYDVDTAVLLSAEPALSKASAAEKP
jgi:hypothetical protein